MTDEKHKTRDKILGELESIRSLLEDENGKALEPPLLTDPIEDDEAPLLTVTWEEESPASDAESADVDSIDPEQDSDIPTLQAVESQELANAESDADGPALKLETDTGHQQDEWTTGEEGEEAEEAESSDNAWDTQGAEHAAGTDEIDAEDADADDLVARALRHHSRPSLFDSAETEADPAELDDSSAAGHQEDPANPDPASEYPNTGELRSEEQPGLFDLQHPAGENAQPQAQPETSNQEAPAAELKTRERQDGPTPKKSENPFLPKHIRDRLSANRALQQEIAKSFNSPPYTRFPPPAPSTAAELSADEQLIDELVQRYLPKIEAELRDKLRALIKKERAESDDPAEE